MKDLRIDYVYSMIKKIEDRLSIVYDLESDDITLVIEQTESPITVGVYVGRSEKYKNPTDQLEALFSSSDTRNLCLHSGTNIFTFTMADLVHYKTDRMSNIIAIAYNNHKIIKEANK